MLEVLCFTELIKLVSLTESQSTSRIIIVVFLNVVGEGGETLRPEVHRKTCIGVLTSFHGKSLAFRFNSN